MQFHLYLILVFPIYFYNSHTLDFAYPDDSPDFLLTLNQESRPLLSLAVIIEKYIRGVLFIDLLVEYYSYS